MLCQIRHGKPRMTQFIMMLGVLFVAMLPGCLYLPKQDPLMSPLPPQGLYESCVPRDYPHCYDRLTQMAKAGFSLVINYDQPYFTAGEDLAYAARAHALGMKIIWAMDDPAFWNGTDLRHYYAALSATCSCSDNAGLIRYLVNLVKALPATWGYYVGDEVEQDHARMKAFSDLVKTVDPKHPRLFVGIGTPTGNNIAPFEDTADVIGSDYYPIGDPAGRVAYTADVARATQIVADNNGKHSAMVLQAFSWGQYPHERWSCSPFPACTRFPTEQEMKQMRDLTLQNSHPALILWFSYYNVLRSDSPSKHWGDVLHAAGVTPPSAKRASTSAP